MLDPEDGGTIILQNSGHNSPSGTASYPKVLASSTSNTITYLNKINKVTLSK
jgi:hypothetical protein